MRTNPDNKRARRSVQESPHTTAPLQLTDLPAELLGVIVNCITDVSAHAQARHALRTWRDKLNYIQTISKLGPTEKEWVRLQLKRGDATVWDLIRSSLDKHQLHIALEEMAGTALQHVLSVLETMGVLPGLTIHTKIKLAPRLWKHMDDDLNKHILVGASDRVEFLVTGGTAPTPTAWELAAEYGNAEMMFALGRSCGVKPTTRAMELAAQFGDARMMSVLLIVGPAPTTRALELAAEFGDAYMVEALVRIGGATPTPWALENALKRYNKRLLPCFFLTRSAGHEDQHDDIMRNELKRLLDSSDTRLTDENKAFILNQPLSRYDLCLDRYNSNFDQMFFDTRFGLPHCLLSRHEVIMKSLCSSTRDSHYAPLQDGHVCTRPETYKCDPFFNIFPMR